MIVFKSKDLIPVLMEARKNKCELMFVKDQGVYFMSEQCERTPQGEVKHIAYARGCHPDVDAFDDWWNKSHDELGGDDFCEYFDPNGETFTAILLYHYDLHISATETHLTLEAVKPV